MSKANRVSDLLGQVGLSPPKSLSTLGTPYIVDFQNSLPESANIARRLLVEQRMSEPCYQPPDKQFVHAFRTKKRKEAAVNGTYWIFSKHEVAKAFHSLICSVPLPPVAVAQALLQFTPGTSLTDLWYTKSLPVDWEKKRKSELFLTTEISRIPWLDTVVAEENLPYVRLLCQMQIGEDVINRALGIALAKDSKDTVALLLSFNATASRFRDVIREHICENNVDLVRLLLSVHSSAMSIDDWRYCLIPAVSQKDLYESLLQCLAHRPELACGPMLLDALRSQNLRATAIILAYAESSNDFTTDTEKICELIFRVESPEKRLKFLKILSHAKVVGDGQAARQQLLTEVEAENLDIVKALVAAGVCVDVSPYNSLLWAIVNLAFEMLEVLVPHATTPLSNWLKHVPDSTSEGDMLRLLAICSSRANIPGESLNWHLVRAVRKKQKKLVRTLAQLGASIDFEQASAVREALRTGDLDILNLLIQCPSSPETLSMAIPFAMRLMPHAKRFQAMEALLQKGVRSQDLAEPLRTVVCEDDGLEMRKLIQLLLAHEANVDSGDRFSNPLLVATRKGNLSVIEMLCRAPLGSYTLSEAITIAYKMRNIHPPRVSQRVIELLLRKGAHGPPVDLTLLNAVKDSEIAMAQLLLAHGIDANNNNGACFMHAVQEANFEMLKVLCKSCKPTHSITQSLLHSAIHPESYSLKTLEVLLVNTPSTITGVESLRTVLALKGNRHVAETVSCFLRHGRDVNMGGGLLLCAALETGKATLLAKVLSYNPSTVSLRQAFKMCAKVEPRSIQLTMMRLLLEKAGTTEIGQSDLLLQETKAAIDGDSQGLKILIRHNPAGDFKGEYLRIAAASGSLKVLNILLSLETTNAVLKQACVAAAESSLSGIDKQSTVRRLLQFRKLREEDMSEVLAKSISAVPGCEPLTKTLLAYGAKVTFTILDRAAQTSSFRVFAALVASTDDKTILVKTFKSAQNASLRPDRRYWVYQHLLDSRAVPRDEISQALLDCISVGRIDDVSLPRLLLEQGAEVGFRSNEVFTIAFRCGSVFLIKLLTNYIKKNSTTCHVFELLPKVPALNADMKLEIYRCLLQRGTALSIISKYSALVYNLESHHRDVRLVRLLLANGVDPNTENARCFVIAAKAEAEPEFRALSKKGSLATVARAMMKLSKTEAETLKWLRICVVERTSRELIGEDDLILQCLRKYPQGTSVLKLLLDNGASVSATTKTRLGPGMDAEDITILIWALMSKTPRICTDSILLLIKKSQRAVLPEYASPRKKLSAAFACVLDASRAPVLEALLELDAGNITRHTMSGQDFSSLIRLQHDIFDKLEFVSDIPELTLEVACLVTGNFKAFVPVISRSRKIQAEATLHFAAFLGLPDFVAWLLQKDEQDANHVSEDFEFLIPLAVACRAQSHPGCIFASSDSWTKRHKKTIQLLAAKTDTTWRSHNKESVLHIALDHGPEVTKLMVEALNIRHDHLRDDKYLYEDRTQIFYSPDQYVNRIMKIEPADKKALLEALAPGKMSSRYYRAVSPGHGNQPDGYIGPPLPLAKLWEAYERGENLFF